MTNVAALPALALIAGAAAGVYAPLPLAAFVACAALGWLALTAALMLPSALKLPHLTFVASMIGFFGAGAALASDATREALTPPILTDSHSSRVDVVGAGAAVPVIVSGRIRADAFATEFGAMFTLATDAIQVDGAERTTAGTVRIAVGGTAAARRIGEWRAGRRVRVTATLAAPLPYLNIGTTNQETRLALAGIRLFGSVKSAAQVELLARGRWWDEAAASVRASVRHAIGRHVAPRDPQSTAIVTAILIGDRAGLDQEVEERLQRAGTFHVIAISGGNIAILTALILGLLRLFGLPPRACAWTTLSAIGLYAFVVGAGASVARAALAAIVYLFARAIDHRTPPLNVLAVVVAVMLVCAPLEIVDAGFWLTCLATLAIMLLAQRLVDRAGRMLHRIAAGVPGEMPDVQARHHAQQQAERIGGVRGRELRTAGDSLRAPTTSARSIGSTRSSSSGRRLGAASSARDYLMARVVEPAIGLLAATVAAEAVLLPVTVYAFSQVSIAGLLLNFIAIPLMTIVQVAGIAVAICAHGVAPIADSAGLIVHLAARAIVASSSIVDAAPWSAPRVAPPPLWLLLACQASLCAAWLGRPPPWLRRIAAIVWLMCLGLVVWALPLPSFTLHAVGSDECQIDDSSHDGRQDESRARGSPEGRLVPPMPMPRSSGAGAPISGWLRVTFLDVAQGDATLVRFPDGRVWLVDAGGALGRFDIGTRIVSPALWALGLRRLSTLVLTHGDRDHIGGAQAMLRDFRPGEVWEGVPVDGHAEIAQLRGEAARRRVRWRIVQSGERVERGVDDAVDIRVWHPSAPRTLRTRVRNDDSIVLELAMGAVSLILPGDIGPSVERTLAAQGLASPRSPPSAPFAASMVNVSAPASGRMSVPLPLPMLSVMPEPPVVPALPVLPVLKVPHHGSRTSSTAAFLDALQPRVAIVSAGRGNRYGHPAPAALARYEARGTEVFRTDRDGAIQLDTDGHTLHVRTCSGRRLTLDVGG